MFSKRVSPTFFGLAAAVTIMTALVPPLASALTMADIMSGQVLGASTCASSCSTRLTSASNASLFVSVTALSFDGSQWTYQINWRRTRNAVGSLFVTLRANRAQTVLAVDPASQSGSQTFTLAPGTGYRAEFYGRPGASGVLLLRKFFTSLPASAAATNNSQAFNPATQSSQATQQASNPVSNNTGVWANLYSAYQLDPTVIDSLGSRVGDGTVASFAPACDSGRMYSPGTATQNAGYGSIHGNNTAGVPVDVACRTVGQNWIGSIDFLGSDQKCYHMDWTGKYQMDCATLQAVANVTPTALPNGQLPTSIFDTSVNWSGLNARCYHTSGDEMGATYGTPVQAICGQYHGFNPAVAPPPVVNPAPASTAPAAGSYIANLYIAYQLDPTALDSIGSMVPNSSGGTIRNFSPTCDNSHMYSPGTSTQSAGYGSIHGSSSVGVPVDVACRTVGQNWIGSIDFQDATGLCHHEDYKGDYIIDCTLLQQVTGITPAQLPNGQLPTSIFDTSVNWSGLNARCYHTSGDEMGATYGTPVQAICGQYHGYNPATAPAPVTNSNPTGSNPSGSTGTSGGTTGTGSNGTTGGMVGSGSILSVQTTVSCNPSIFYSPGTSGSSPGYGYLHGSATVGVPASVACSTVGENWIGSVDFLGSDNNCYHWDWTGQSQISCSTLAHPQALPNGHLPASIYDTSVNWSAYNAHCYHTSGDTMGAIYGNPTEVFCGLTNGF